MLPDLGQYTIMLAGPQGWCCPKPLPRSTLYLRPRTLEVLSDLLGQYTNLLLAALMSVLPCVQSGRLATDSASRAVQPLVLLAFKLGGRVPIFHVQSF